MTSPVAQSTDSGGRRTIQTALAYPYQRDADLVGGALEHDGEVSLIISDNPGIGVELAPDAAEKHPYRMRWSGTRLDKDGSVRDQ
ncbi:MAG: hypothetical protein ACRDIY_21100 [Chloroflexota bacterium]